MTNDLHVLAVEPYYGGSHKAFIDGLMRHSRHRIELFSLPARKWKWRMRASAINLAQWVRCNKPHVDVLFASDFLSMADFAGLCPEMADVPKIAYFHENQFTYPEQEEANRDYQFLFTNITTCLAADKVYFNSEYHRSSMTREVALFLQRMPDFVPEGVAEEIEAKSGVLHVGCELSECDAVPAAGRSGPAVIVWNHRWEHDKDPETFFEVLFELADAGADFRLIVVGEHFREHPAIFDVARERLSDRIVHFGYLPDRRGYLELLKAADVAFLADAQLVVDHFGSVMSEIGVFLEIFADIEDQLFHHIGGLVAGRRAACLVREIHAIQSPVLSAFHPLVDGGVMDSQALGDFTQGFAFSDQADHFTTLLLDGVFWPRSILQQQMFSLHYITNRRLAVGSTLTLGQL